MLAEIGPGYCSAANFGGARGSALARRAKTQPAQAVERRREISAGGVIWRHNAQGEVEVVLVRPAGKESWVLPKGHVEPGESVKQAAARECREETGLAASIGPKLGEISYVYSQRAGPDAPLVRIFKRVCFFLMDFQGGDPAGHDSEIAEVRWWRVEDALRAANHENERDMIAAARSLIG